MKKILLFVLILFAYIGYGQVISLDPKVGMAVYSDTANFAITGGIGGIELDPIWLGDSSQYYPKLMVNSFLDNKLNISDTATMLSTYLQGVDTISLSNRINNKLSKVDTLSLSNRINQKLNISDTTNKWQPKGTYLTTETDPVWNSQKSGYVTSTQNQIKADTTWVIGKGYLKGADTLSLSNRINKKLNISDTATMLSPYTKLSYLNTQLNLKQSKADTSTYDATRQWVENRIKVYRAQANVTNVSTTSLIYTDLVGCSLTVSNPTFNSNALIMFTAEVSQTNNDKQLFFIILKNGVPIAATERKVDAHADRGYNVAINQIISVSNGDVIKVQWKTDANTGIVVRGTLTINN